MVVKNVVGVLLLLLMGDAVLSAQGAATDGPVFEVASVKRNVSGRVGGSFQVPPAGTITFTNITLRVVIRQAYQVDPYTEPYTFIPGPFARIIGSPIAGAEPNVPRFDIQGKPPANSAPADRRAMMRALLEDRFKLRVHRETRQMPVYALTVAREGRLGPNLGPSRFDCDAYLAQRRAGGTAPEPVDARGHSWCLPPIDRSRPGVENIRTAGSVKQLMQRLQPYVDRPIVDTTELSGNFEWSLTFARSAGGPNPAGDVAELFTAVQDQLGLKLEPREAAVDVLVIDAVEMPTPD